MKEQRVIMGIDPGTNILGFGVILIDKKKTHLIDMGVIDLRKMGDHFSKLNIILSEVGELIDRYKPDDFAVEAPFYGKNPQVMLKLGRAQGAALSAAFCRSVPVYEYAPRKVKIAITGNGAASKEQVSLMLQKTLGTTFDSKWLDASDAVAIALCHFYQLNNPLADLQTSASWEDYLKAHPEKLKI
jgi:crossover junction endodeoxyribonuclease RuvC